MHHSGPFEIMPPDMEIVMKLNYRSTLYACYIGYITQAIINNLLPLLFVVLRQEFALSVPQIGFMVTYNFAVQILVDFLAAKYAEKIGCRNCMVTAHIFCAAGLVGLGFLPDALAEPYLGLMLCITVYAIGGGLIEVLVSPIVQALPLERKEAVMSLLHSFYCWGHAGVVLLTTLFFALAGTAAWRLLACLWAIVPAANVLLFLVTPIPCLSEGGESMSMGSLFRSRLFWLFVLLMLCSGASEQAMSQWSSFFAEEGLHVSKTVGDLLGPCMFALLMGLSRWFYGTRGDGIPLRSFIVASGALCVVSYLIAVFSPVPVLSLIGCGVCGLSVGIMWPGVFSLSAETCPQGGTAMFALLALAGDVGCSSGPSVVSGISALFGGELKAGLLAAIVFPLLLIAGIRSLQRQSAPGGPPAASTGAGS